MDSGHVRAACCDLAGNSEGLWLGRQGLSAEAKGILPTFMVSRRWAVGSD